MSRQAPTKPEDVGTGAAARSNDLERKRPRRRSAQRFTYRYALLLVLVLEVIVFSLVLPDTFLSVQNFQNIIRSQAILVIVTLGLTIPLLAGEFDLSVGATLGFSMVLVGYLTALNGWALAPALLVVLVACLAIGSINALVIVRLEVNSLIATLGTGSILLGLSILLSDSALIPGLPSALSSAVRTDVLGLPLTVFYAFAAALLLWFVYEHSPVGRRLLFVGASRDAARLGGLRVDALRRGSLLASAVCAGAAGVFLAGELGASDPSVGNQYLLPAFAGAFLGATTIKPGRFNAWGTVVALYLLITGVTGLQLLGAGAWVQSVFDGCALVVGVAATRFLGRRLERGVHRARE